MIKIIRSGKKGKEKFTFECKKCFCKWIADTVDVSDVSEDYYDNLTATMDCPECKTKTLGISLWDREA